MKKRLPKGFRCECCGELHTHAPTDFGFQLPDEAWEMPSDEKDRRLVANADFCAIDRTRFFIRCVAKVPFVGQEGFFAWGLWVEVAKADFFAYEGEEDGLKQFPGRIANRLRGYPSLHGKPVQVQPESGDFRPTLQFPPTARHPMALEQRAGIGRARHYAMLHENAPWAL